MTKPILLYLNIRLQNNCTVIRPADARISPGWNCSRQYDPIEKVVPDRRSKSINLSNHFPLVCTSGLCLTLEMEILGVVKRYVLSITALTKVFHSISRLYF